LPELFSRWFVVPVPCVLAIAALLLNSSNFAIGWASAIAATTSTTSRTAVACPTRRGGGGGLFPASLSTAQTRAVTTQAIAIQPAAVWPWCTPSAVSTSPLTRAFLGTNPATATAPANPATTSAARAGHRFGVSTTNATTATPAATKAPRDD